MMMTTLTTATTRSTKTCCCSSKSSSPSVPPLITARRKTNNSTNTRRRKRRTTTTRRRATTTTTSNEMDAFEAKSSKNLKCELVSNVANRFTVKGTILLGAHVNADDVYNMLTDYENASRVFPSTIKKVEYLGFEEEELEDGEARRPGAVKRIKQTCNWKFFIFGGNFNIELGVVENDAKRHMTCTLEGAASQRKFGFLREFEGSWEVEENGEEGTKVTHVLSVKPSLTPPYASDIFVKQVEGILEDVEREVGSWENGYAVPMHRR
ncbi:unnamed protein product [Bathycoccus prasinos]